MRFFFGSDFVGEQCASSAVPEVSSANYCVLEYFVFEVFSDIEILALLALENEFLLLGNGDRQRRLSGGDVTLML